MKTFKEISLKLLYPNIVVFILLFIIGFGSVTSVFVLGLENHWFAYISYLLSAYALTITVMRSINLVNWINKKLHDHKYTNRLITDKDLKNKINLFSGTFFNMIYGIFKFATGIIYKSTWFAATGVYYLILGMMKLSLTSHIIKNSDIKKQLTQYRNTGILIFLLNIAMVGMIILMIRGGESAVYPGYMIFVQAGYTFYILITAIIEVIRYQRNHTPLISAAKSINLVAAIMSMFILQIAMINEFGETGSLDILNMISGTVVSIATIGIAIYMLMNLRKTNHNKKTKHNS